MTYTLIDDSGRVLDTFRSFPASHEVTHAAKREGRAVSLVHTLSGRTVSVRRAPVSR